MFFSSHVWSDSIDSVQLFIWRARMRPLTPPGAMIQVSDDFLVRPLDGKKGVGCRESVVWAKQKSNIFFQKRYFCKIFTSFPSKDADKNHVGSTPKAPTSSDKQIMWLWVKKKTVEDHTFGSFFPLTKPGLFGYPVCLIQSTDEGALLEPLLPHGPGICVLGSCLAQLGFKHAMEDISWYWWGWIVKMQPWSLLLWHWLFAFFDFLRTGSLLHYVASHCGQCRQAG